MIDIRTALFIFVCFSLVGWVMEFTFRSLRACKCVNPGFLFGPYLPLYGTAAVILALIATLGNNLNIWFKIILYFITTTGLEFCTGLIFHDLLNRPLWDYSNEKWIIKKHVCIKYSLAWVALAYGFTRMILPWSLKLLNVTKIQNLTILLCFMGLTMIADLILNLIASLKWMPIVKKAENIPDREEFSKILKPLMEIEDVSRLSQCKHHLEVSRLEHSLDVAWMGYACSKKMGLDYTAAARAGLLHDLFFYDWLRDGPRLHGFRHPQISLNNALKITNLSHKERDIILKHMWPLTIIPPRYKESWIVCMADTYCSCKEILRVTRRAYEK